MTKYPKMFMGTMEIVEQVGIPKRVLLEIVHMPGARSVLRGGKGKGNRTIFDTRLLDSDLSRWKKLNN